MSKRKYEKGKQVHNINQLEGNEFLYIRNKIWHPAWWGSLQYSYLKRIISWGVVYFADKIK